MDRLDTSAPCCRLMSMLEAVMSCSDLILSVTLTHTGFLINSGELGEFNSGFPTGYVAGGAVEHLRDRLQTVKNNSEKCAVSCAKSHWNWMAKGTAPLFAQSRLGSVASTITQRLCCLVVANKRGKSY